MKETKPKTVGLSAGRLRRLETTMQHLIEQQKTAGVVMAIARRGKLAYFKALGWRDLETDQPMALDTIFRIYSMTKPITSLAVLMLFEKGHFQLSDPIAAYIPAFKEVKVYGGPALSGVRLENLKRPITVRDLLTHTSGLTYGLLNDSPVEEMYRQTRVLEATITLEEMIERLVQLPLYCQPGAMFRYSVATDVLGRLVEVISGQPFDRFLKTHIFEPLGMVETGFYVPEPDLERFAALYGLAESGSLKPGTPMAVSHYRPSQRLFSGGAGLVSTAADYLRFTQMLLNQGELAGERLVSRKTIELMTANHLPASLCPIQVGVNPPLAGYGFGLGVRVLIDLAQSQTLGSVGEYGWSGAASTYFWIDPAEEFTGVFLTQLVPSGGHPLGRMFKLLAYQAIDD